MNNNTTILTKLKELTSNSNCYYKHASAIIKGNNVLSYGYNFNKLSFSRHAEIDACINYLNNTKSKTLKGLDIIVIRSNNDSIKSSKPCKYCIDFMRKKGVRKVYYSNENGDIVSEYTDSISSEHLSAYYIYRRRRPN